MILRGLKKPCSLSPRDPPYAPISFCFSQILETRGSLILHLHHLKVVTARALRPSLLASSLTPLKLIEVSRFQGALNAALVEAIKPHVLVLRSHPYGKKVILSSNNLKK
ncbi:uncharacterized protein A4U43_C05F24010 [Asparagus officinalis]|uniref:Uncharacterized protein n=1 Tax=Asparagus officinalis TaxID=4686 RepID=A0A5P1EU76_ASPOF|nr:uncharacterized protein A4U43_C05F24010 [Asparagus officinalis]